MEGCESKWAAVPSRIPRSAQFFVHEILCYAEDGLAVRTGLRHFKAINVNWAVDTPGVLSERTRTRADSDLMADAELQDQLMIAFGDVPRSLETASSRATASGAAKAAPDMSGSVWRAQDAPAEAHYCQGMYHLHTGAYGDAARSFWRALERDSRFVPAYYALGRLHWSSGRPGAAERIFRRGLAHAPYASLIHYGLAEILSYVGLRAEALEHADTAIRLNDADSRAHFLRAKELLALGRPAEACAAARRVIEIQSDTALFYKQHSDAIEQPFSNRYPEQKSWGGWTILIDGLLQSNMAGEALEESDRLVKRYPASPAAHEARYRVLSRLGEEEAARHELEKAIKLARGELEYPPPRALGRLRELHWYEDRACDLHRLLLLAGETQEALAVLKTAQRLHPGIHRVSFLLTAQLREAGAREELREHLEASLQVFPRHPDLWREYGQALAEAGETAHAILALRRAVRLGARQPWLKTQLALLLIDEGSLEEAELILRDILESGAGNGAALYGLSEAFRKKGQLQEAIEACRRAAALLECEAWIWSHLGDLLIQAKLLDEAEEKLKQAECLKPADMLTNFRIGRLHEERGEIAAALERMSRAVSIEPRHGWLWRHYGNLLLAAGEDRKAEAAHRRADEADGAATRIEPMVTRAKADPERAN